MSLWSNTDAANSKPKYLSTADKAKAFFVSAEESQTPANKAKGITHGGWWLYSTYTDAQSATRHKAECLVAMGTANAVSGDAADDAVVVDPAITIGTQPTAASVTSPADVVFTVAATATNGGTLAYAWEVSTDSGSTWSAITGATAATLTVSDGDAEYVTGNQFRVTVSTAGAANVTSDAVAATIA